MNASLPSIALSKCHYPVRGLGWGVRVGIWLQGCSIGCRGCIVPETWAATTEHAVTLPALLQALLPWLDACDGVTISGGEPFDQPDALAALLAALRALTTGDLLVYSGFPWAILQRRHADVLARADAVVSEPFVASRRAPNPWLMGSTNQRLHGLTPMGRERYAGETMPERQISLAQNAQSLDLAGILRPGELQRLERSLTQQGWAVGLTHAAI